ncbi:hypothetical protein [Lacipirellula parvula]|uniref:Uncharacterized protein n=1 Tax=Lacipirellula parvula TaxID=2650471 RepID=A0A5K7XC60_9BACT|nr:hypothetical protein [Lacipirellula parvula]BBO32441.1 hypothetical protein PLANPX_2053 [Lacipirellula parvula]
MSISAITTRPSTATAAIDAMLSKARTAYFTACSPSAAAHRARQADKQRTVTPPRSFSAKLGGERIICTTAADAADIDFVDRLLEGSARANDEATWDRLIELMLRHGRHRAARRLADLRDAAAV